MDNGERKSESTESAEEQQLLRTGEKNKSLSLTKLGVSRSHSDRQTSPRSVRKQSFMVWNATRSIRTCVRAHSIDELCNEARTKLGLNGALTIVLEGNGTEIDEDGILLDPEGPCRKDAILMLLKIGEKWTKESLQEKSQDEQLPDPLYLLQVINQRSNELRHIIDSDMGLLEELRDLGLLSDEDYEDVRKMRNYFKKNDRLLHYIKLKNTEHELLSFLVALRKTDQLHVANMILANGERLHLRFGLERPLGSEELNQLKANGRFLMDKLEVTVELLSLLYAAGAINDRHKEHINSQRTPINKITELLDIMKKRSVAAFEVFISALRKTNQSFVADALSKPGAIVPMHINITYDMHRRDIKAIESDLAAKMDELREDPSNFDKEAFDSLWTLIKERFIKMELDGIRYKGSCQGNSITVFFWCRDIRSMSCLQQMLESGELEKLFQQMMTFLAYDVLSFTLKINKDEWKMAENYFEESGRRDEINRPIPSPPSAGKKRKSETNDCAPGTSDEKIFQRDSEFDMFPNELVEMILKQSLISYVRLPWKSFIPPFGYQALILMASVCQEWEQLLTGRTLFTRSIKKYMKKNKHLALLHEHHAIFDECLEVDCVFLWEMNRSNLMTDEQVSEIGSESDHLKQTEQLFRKVFLRFSAGDYAKFCRVLQRTSQGHIANYLEANGVIDLSSHDEWPLNDKSKAQLDSAQSRLGDFVPSHDFLKALEGVDCITTIQAKSLSSLPDGQKLNELTRTLRKRSYAAYRQFSTYLWMLDQHDDVILILTANNGSEDLNPVDMYAHNGIPDLLVQSKELGEEPDLKAVERALADILLKVGERLLSGQPVALRVMIQIRALWRTLERLKPEVNKIVSAVDSEATDNEKKPRGGTEDNGGIDSNSISKLDCDNQNRLEQCLDELKNIEVYQEYRPTTMLLREAFMLITERFLFSQQVSVVHRACDSFYQCPVACY